MYDWNALWHTHQGYRTGYVSTQDDINEMASELGAKRVKPADGADDIAVYESDDQFILIARDNGLQILTLPKHFLFSISVRFVTQDEGAPIGLPYVEVRVTNPATRENASWRGAVRRDEAGRILLEKRLLSDGVMPAMPFDDLSFTDQSRFRDALYQAWQNAAPGLLSKIRNWVPDSERDQIALARYREILKYEQAGLSRIFSQSERQLLTSVLSLEKFIDPASCRGLWLKVESNLLESTPELDIDALLEKMRRLSYVQEVALVEQL